jgi:hypothetical protein
MGYGGICKFRKHAEEDKINLSRTCQFSQTIWNMIWTKCEMTVGEHGISKTKLETSNQTIILGSPNVNSTLRQIHAKIHSLH